LKDLFILFFFSSRRRHTRFSRDWSSDVCSSDLYSPKFYYILFDKNKIVNIFIDILEFLLYSFCYSLSRSIIPESFVIPLLLKNRSEERRVGKECRFRL